MQHVEQIIDPLISLLTPSFDGISVRLLDSEQDLYVTLSWLAQIRDN